MNGNGLARSVPTLLVEESRLFREGLKRILAGSSYIIQKEADSLEDAIEQINQGFSPELLLLDFHENDADVVAGIRSLRNSLKNSRIVVLTFDVSTSKLAKALEAGADAYLLYDMSPEALIQSLTLAMLGEKVFPTNLAQMLIDGRLNTSNGHKFSAGALSEREIQILRCLVNGDPNKVIATRLRITEATVKVSLKGLLRKIHASNRTQAAIWAVEQGIDRYPLSTISS